MHPTALAGTAVADNTIQGCLRHDRLTAVAVIAVTGGALALRLAGLDRKSVWFDEALGAEAALLPLGQLLDTVGAERNPPLYFILQHYWLTLQVTDWWLRVPAAVAGGLGVGVAMLFAREIVGARWGIFAGVMVALSPFAIDLSQEARPYGLFFLCASLSLLCLWHGSVRGGRWWLGYVAATVCALYTHNYAVLLLIAEALFVVGLMATRRALDTSGVLSIGAVALLFAPWVAHLAGQVQLVSAGFWIERPPASAFWDTLQAFQVYAPLDHGDGTNLLLKVIRWLVLGLLLLAVVFSHRVRPALLAASSLLVPIGLAVVVSLLVVPIYVVRYVSFATGAFWTLVVYGLTLVPVGALRLALAALVLVGVAVNLPALYDDPFYSRPDLRAAVGYVQSNWHDGDLVVHTDEFSAVPFDYYYYATSRVLEQVLLAPGDVAELCTAVSGHPRVWLVRNFSLQDPGDADTAERESMAYLSALRLEEQRAFLGVHLFLTTVPEHCAAV